MTRRGAWGRAGALLAVVVAADQATKAAVRARLAPGESRHVAPGLHLVRSANDGIAFGFLGGGGTVVAIVVGLALVAIAAHFVRDPVRRLAWLPTGLLLGGAVGNVLDRVREGAVTDFLKLPHWPAFNLADMAITAGVVALVMTFDARDDR